MTEEEGGRFVALLSINNLETRVGLAARIHTLPHSTTDVLSPSIDHSFLYFSGTVTPAVEPASLHPGVHHIPSLAIFIFLSPSPSFILNLQSTLTPSLPSSRNVSLFSAVPGRRSVSANQCPSLIMHVLVSNQRFPAPIIASTP